MPHNTLSPTLGLLQAEYVLVQAWKKAHDYVRAHNWYADVLELDLSNTRLRSTIEGLRQELQRSDDLAPALARLVLAPKTTNWEVGKNFWRPKRKEKQRVRPLVHLPIRDQTIATAFMLCMADRVETLQGNPEWPFEKYRARGMMSYGHRLLTDEQDGGLRYRWGNAAYYRGYFEDYQEFIRRPDAVVSSEFVGGENWAIVHADFSQFYDRVRPEALFEKVVKHFNDIAESEFLSAFKRFFGWRWHPNDRKNALDYAQSTSPVGIEGFDQLALPQGLAASGFLANLFLIDFDHAIWELRNRNPGTGWRIVDYCRYVDDLRLVLQLTDRKAPDSGRLRAEITTLLRDCAGRTAPGMVLNPEKTSVLLGRNEASRVVIYSNTMKAIQSRVSGVVDLQGGDEMLTMIEGLFASEPEQSPLAEGEPADADPYFAVLRDVKDETVARFSANRFRRTFRLVRPLASDGGQADSGQPVFTKAVLDHRAVHFARRLIWRWVKDPSNVRLLRVSLDLYPDPDAAKRIIALLRPHIIEGASRGAVRKVVEYCVAEIFKAAATEVGAKAEAGQLPAGASPLKVQQVIAAFAQEVVRARARLPWYLVQQALLVLAAAGRPVSISRRENSPPEWRHYLTLHDFLRGQVRVTSVEDAVRFSLIAESFDTGPDQSLSRFRAWLTASSNPTDSAAAIRLLLEEDLGAGERLWRLLDAQQQRRWGDLFASYGIQSASNFPNASDQHTSGYRTFAIAEFAPSLANPFHQEYLSLWFLRKVLQLEPQLEGALTPWRLNIEADWRTLYPDNPRFLEPDFTVRSNIVPDTTQGCYELPDWLPQSEHWRYRVGQVLRTLVTGNLDFTLNSNHRRQQVAPGYRPYGSHWYRRRYGLFNGRAALGPDWLPVSSWFCSLLSRLLAWPGFTFVEDETGLGDLPTREGVVQVIASRIDRLRKDFGRSSAAPVLPQVVRLRAFKNASQRRNATAIPFRIAVVQTVLPRADVLLKDPELTNPTSRYEQLRHFTAALSALDSMLRLRETHTPQDGRVDLLVLPELSIHPDDVGVSLEPFARKHRCIVFGGLIYHRLAEDPRRPLINAGLWLLPTENSVGGLRMERVRQGKRHLAPKEEASIAGLKGWRPCQHIIQLVGKEISPALWTFSGSICYDATDLALANDLRNLTDMWIVPALNRDVSLFDTMVAALHYHMFQHIVLCNSGEFGGSVTQAPISENFKRTILHHHGNEQSVISFFELDLNFHRKPNANLKTRPAGLSR